MRLTSKNCSPQARIQKGSTIDPVTGCWNWNGGVNAKGYAHLKYEMKMHRANRFSWAAFKGPIPDGLLVLHDCDNRLCVNPAHFFLGTARDNNEDRDRKGRHRSLSRAEHPLAKLTEKEVAEIRQSTENRDVLSLRYGVNKSNISHIQNYRTWKSTQPSKETT